MASRASAHQELKKLDIRLRNQVRAIATAELEEGVKLFNSVRRKRSVRELIQVDIVLEGLSHLCNVSIPSRFPAQPQTSETYRRLKSLPVTKQLELLNALCEIHAEKVTLTARYLKALNLAIVNNDLITASELIGNIQREVGASQLLLRKAALISVVRPIELVLAEVDALLESAGITKNNLIPSSLVNCYQEGQDFLSMKKSMLNLPDKSDSNKYTRDILRWAFHPHAKDVDDLAELLQSNMQSSLVDAILIAKANKHHFDSSGLEFLNATFLEFELSSNLSEIAQSYLTDDDGEENFYKRSSAWLENDLIIQYRTLQDNFYDLPESPYIEINDELLARVDEWVAPVTLSDLAQQKKLTRHCCTSLSHLEISGFTTRSSVFNYLIARTEGYSDLSEADLIILMSRTRDLSKTINPKYLKNLASCAQTQLSKLIYFLLIARRSRNEADDHQLRRILQQLVLKEHGKRLPEFVGSVSKKSRVIAEYMYEVFTEDFIAKLSKIIETASQITETRAALHRFMGELTGEKAYIDRARTLLIDHQINKLRNEIDDNRIYVDASRFQEWINDELMRELNAVLTSMDLVSLSRDEANPQILQIIGKCYAAFCGSTVFGIASYLGRRIRHGTFKGHLYASLINLARTKKYQALLEESQVSQIWLEWQKRYETLINEIIVERLHVESANKRQALLKPGLDDLHKTEVAAACAKAVWREYSERKTSQTIPQILIEYCWRLLEVDLKNVNTFLKGKKAELIGADLLTRIRTTASRSELATTFSRDITHHINEKLSAMYGWFKRPISASPKASLSLLFRAVVAEVQDTFADFKVNLQHENEEELEIVGGAYHVLYDAFYVVIYNAAKHGHDEGEVKRSFGVVQSSRSRGIAVNITITSQVRDTDSDEFVNARLHINPDDNLENAQVSEDRSGIRKLHQLARSDLNFSIDFLHCVNRQVTVSMSYSLEH